MIIRKEVYSILIDTLNNYDYCILRNYEILPQVNNDIDILVNKGSTTKLILDLITNLKSCSVLYLYKVDFSCVSVFFFDSVSDTLIHIDLFESIKWKVFEYLSATDIINTRVKYKNFYIPHPFYEMHELLLTRLIYHGKIKEIFKNKILILYENNKKIVYVNNRLKFNNEISLKNWNLLEKKVNIIRVKIIFSNLLEPIKLITNSISFLSRISNRIKTPPGLFLAFYGVDGSGKTTQIKLTIESFRGIYSDKVKLFHFRPTLIYRKPIDMTISNPHNQLKTNFIRSFIKLVYYVFIYNWGYFTQVLPFIAKNWLVIFDRYYFDILLDPIRYRIILPNFIIKLFGKLIPKPHLNIALLSNSKSIYSRKPELDLSEIERQQSLIKQTFINKDDFLIKSDVSTNETFDEIRNIIIKYVSKKN